MPVRGSDALGVFSISGPFPGATCWFPSLGDRGQVCAGSWAAPAQWVPVALSCQGRDRSPAAAMALCLGKGIGVGKWSREYFYIFPSFFLSLSSSFFFLS